MKEQKEMEDRKETAEKSHRKILIVDDEIMICKMMAMHLKEYDVEFATSFQRAMEILNENPIHLVITDVRMPGKSGYDLIKEMNSIQKKIPVVIMSGSEEAVDMTAKGFQFGAFTCLEKPFTKSDVISAVRFALEKDWRMAG